jgi:hypothetical protein
VTWIVLEVPVMKGLAVSVAVIVWGPAVLKVALKVPMPLARVLEVQEGALPEGQEQLGGEVAVATPVDLERADLIAVNP